MKTPIVQLQQFIQAIRDAGYRGTGSALAELVDNAFESDAKVVDIDVRSDPEDTSARVIVVSDDGSGMTPATLELALQFGGSSRFGKRTGTGRFGMGLPNSSVSQARRLEVYTWRNPKKIWFSYLDVDEICKGTLCEIPDPVRSKIPCEFKARQGEKGTVIVLRKCDRLSLKRDSALIRRLKRELGRIFRRMLWDGRILRINGETVQPVDPLFLHAGDNLTGASLYGNALEYTIRDDNESRCATGKVIARFVELPVSEWMSLSNVEKQAHGISKGAGVSVLRDGREIDFGWFFMGGKRKENYDDWWRCEIEFPPELDELFGVTHTKQGITPSEYVTQLLAPDFEAIAHKLNARVRIKFMKRKNEKILSSERHAGACDKLFAPPKRFITSLPVKAHKLNGLETDGGLRFKLAIKILTGSEFYAPKLSRAELRVILNEQHPFYERFYKFLINLQQCDARTMANGIELLLFAAARAEVGVASARARATIADFRRNWSDLVSAYLS